MLNVKLAGLSHIHTTYANRPHQEVYIIHN